MALRRCNISLIIGLLLLFSVQVFSQQMNTGGSLSAITFSPSLSVPLSPKLSVDGGIIAGYYHSTPGKSSNEGLAYGSFTGLSVYGSASYHFNPQFTLYGSAIKELAGTSPFNVLPKTSYSIGSMYDFGNFKIGVSIHTSKWDDMHNNPFPINGSQGFYSPYDQRRIFY